MIATGPDGVKKSLKFKIKVEPDCSNQIITPSIAVNQTYKVNSGRKEYEAPTFDNDEEQYCPLTYSQSFDTS